MRIRLGVAFVAAMCLCTVLLAGCAGGTDDADQGDETVKIGVIVSETGTYAALGESERDAIELEVERINEAGGIDGRMIEAIIEDDATDEAQAVSAASKLIEQDGVVAIVGATGTGQSMAFRSEIQRAGIPQVSMAGGSVITAEFDSQVFQTPWPNRLVVPFILDVMADEGLTRVGLISDSGGYGKDGRSVILDTADAAGIEIVADETYNAGDSDMTAQLTKINSQDPDAILMWTAGSGAVTIAKNKAQLGIDLPIFGGPGIARMEFNEGAGEDAEDVILAAGKILLPETYGEGSDAFEVATAFIDRYEESYGEEPDIFAGHAYDALHLVVQAIDRLDGDVDPGELRSEIEATSGFVGVGGTFSFSSEDHNGLSEDDLHVYRIVDGAWTSYAE